MIHKWNDIKWIFEQDGSLRDIYVQEVSISDWEILIDLLNKSYSLTYGPSNNGENIFQINKDYVVKLLVDKSGEIESKSSKVDLDGIKINCHFFLPDQIEFDIDPKEINTLMDFEKLIYFMETVSKTLSNQVTLTGESNPEFPLIKIDTEKGIQKILTEKEAEKLITMQNPRSNQLASIKTRIKMKYFPKLFEKQLLKSANQTYKSTGKNKNVW